MVGLTNGYHTGMVIASRGDLVHAQRICQVTGLKLELQAKHVRPDGRPSHAYLQVSEQSSPLVGEQHKGVPCRFEGCRLQVRGVQVAGRACAERHTLPAGQDSGVRVHVL